MAKVQQRNLHRNARLDLVISAVSFRYSIYPNRQIPSDSVAESGQLLKPLFSSANPQAVTARLSSSHCELFFDLAGRQ